MAIQHKCPKCGREWKCNGKSKLCNSIHNNNCKCDECYSKLGFDFPDDCNEIGKKKNWRIA